MPLYSYEVIREDGAQGEVFEALQRMADPPLTRHPETGAPIRRLISAARVAGKNTDRAINSTLRDNKRLEQLGFTKYERAGKGVMERKAGTQGPKMISAE